MRVFVLGTGRCGSVTFWRACLEISNYTTGHEDVYEKDDKLDWPDNHIAVEPGMWPLVPVLRQRFPDLFLVHLIRLDREAFIDSYRILTAGPLHRDQDGKRIPVIDVWASCHVGAPLTEAERRDRLGLFYDTVNGSIKAWSPDVTIRLERAAKDWPKFWNAIGAEGNYKAAIAQWKIKHNSRESRRSGSHPAVT